MSYTLKGFIGITAFADNFPGETSPLGELSNQSLTYSKEKGYYAKTEHDNVKLTSFTSIDGTGKAIVVPARISDHVLELSQWCFDKSIEGTLTGDGELFKTLLLTEFGVKITKLDVGRMEVADGNWLPTFIEWELDDGGDENLIKIWFAEGAFNVQYDGYEIIVIPPIEHLDEFHKTVDIVKPLLDAFTLEGHHENVAIATAPNPYTFLVSKDYTWYDKEDKDTFLPTDWSVAIYGIAGNNPILIKEAIADFILANSVYLRPDWIPIFPDIFTSTEFTFVPMWHLTSIPDEKPEGEIYSPLAPYNVIREMALKYMYGYADAHIDDNLISTGIQYKSLTSVVSGGEENKDGKSKLTDYFPDYALISTVSVDFNRMSQFTTDFIKALIKAVIAAETIDEYSFLDNTMSRIVREDRLYVGFDYDDVLYLVLSRNSMEETQPEPDPE